MSIENTIGLQVYIIDLMSNVNGLLALVCVVLFIPTIFLFITILKGEDNFTCSDNQIGRSLLRKCAYAFVFCLIVGIFIPSKSTMYFMMADGIIKEVRERKIPEKALQVLDEKLNEYLRSKE